MTSILAEAKAGLDSCNRMIEIADHEVLAKLQLQSDLSITNLCDVRFLCRIERLNTRVEELEKRYDLLETETKNDATKIKRLSSMKYVYDYEYRELETQVSALELQCSEFLLEIQKSGSNQVVISPPTPPTPPSPSLTLVPGTTDEQPTLPPPTPPQQDARPLTPTSMSPSSSDASDDRQASTTDLPNTTQSRVHIAPPSPAASQTPQQSKPGLAQDQRAPSRNAKIPNWPRLIPVKKLSKNREHVNTHRTSSHVHSPAVLGAEFSESVKKFVNSMVEMANSHRTVINGAIDGLDVRRDGNTCWVYGG